MIERWFPCAEVSEASAAGWGSGNAERSLFSWFAARPAAQAKAAVLTSLLPWPEDEDERTRLQDLVKEAMTGRYTAADRIRKEITDSNGDDVSILDPFSGRGMIPLEAARLGIRSYGVDYSPVAVVASEGLTDYPLRDWSNEPSLPFEENLEQLPVASDRLVSDTRLVLREIGRRHERAMAEYYPKVDERQPWGYLWAITQSCQECHRRFPVVGSYRLRFGSTKRGRRGRPDMVDAGQSFFIDADVGSGEFHAVVHDGPPRRDPTFINMTGPGGKKVKGKTAVCPFCDHAHPLAVHQRLAADGDFRDALLVVAEIDPEVGKAFRAPTPEEAQAATRAESALNEEPPFELLPAVPDEQIPLNNGATIRPQLYGAKTYGDLMCPRQTLSFVRLARAIDDVAVELAGHGCSDDYVRALTGYAVANMLRKIKYSTRGSNLQLKPSGAVMVNHIFVNESTIAFSQDFFEAGIGEGPGTWTSLMGSGVSTLKRLVVDGQHPTRSTVVTRGSAAVLSFRDKSMTAVVTDPPYDAMVYYSDASDLYYAWMKRALAHARPELSFTTDPRGLQEKDDEIIVKDHGRAPGEHRTQEHYDSRIAAAFSEMRRVVKDDGTVTIVFGHGEPEVWKRLLGAIQAAGLVMTGSWPARTEAGGQQGKANIETTLTMACRPAASNRPEGRRAAVESAVRKEVRDRIELWTMSGLAPTDMLMASAGPAMEVVGRYCTVLDAKGESVDIDVFLPIARQAVQEGEALEIDHHPLETFDARTRFALWWVRLFGRQESAKSELRWQALASSLDLTEVRDLVPDAKKGCAFVTSKKFTRDVRPESAVIDVALRMAKRWPDGLDAVGEALIDARRDAEDAYLWATISFLADRLPDSDPDAIVWTGILRNRKNVGSAARGVVTRKAHAADEERKKQAQGSLFDVDVDEVQV